MSMFLSFSTRVMLHLFPISSLDFLYHVFGHLMHNPVTNLLVIQALLFDLGSTESQIFRLCKALSAPAFLQGGC